jgi:hypothetical protein
MANFKGVKNDELIIPCDTISLVHTPLTKSLSIDDLLVCLLQH